MSNRWAAVEKVLDREVRRQTNLVLKRIDALVSGKTPKAASNGNGHTKPIKTAKRGAKNARQLHGSYLGLTRTLTDQQKRDVKDIRERKGVRAAIKAAKAYRKAATA